MRREFKEACVFVIEARVVSESEGREGLKLSRLREIGRGPWFEQEVPPMSGSVEWCVAHHQDIKRKLMLKGLMDVI